MHDARLLSDFNGTSSIVQAQVCIVHRLCHAEPIDGFGMSSIKKKKKTRALHSYNTDTLHLLKL